jgi:hypothetical protein
MELQSNDKWWHSFNEKGWTIIQWPLNTFIHPEIEGKATSYTCSGLYDGRRWGDGPLDTTSTHLLFLGLSGILFGCGAKH